jgi:hypothetical protein
MSCIMTFTDEELDELERILQHELTRAAVEVHRTDSLEFKRALQHQCDLDEALLGKVRSAAKTPAGV